MWFSEIINMFSGINQSMDKGVFPELNLNIMRILIDRKYKDYVYGKC